MSAPAQVAQTVGPPMWLLVELTYRCPLHCVFCSNPTEFAATGAELATADWLRVLREARALGAVQLGLSGGEPLARDDLEPIVAEAHSLGYYINLITSGIGMTEERIRALKAAGLDHIQLSFQDSSRELNDFLSSTRTFELKSRVAALIRKYDYPMVLNVVLHRLNIDHVDEILAMAERIGADYVELANTQYYGWAHLNRDALIPTREQLASAEGVVEAAIARYRGRMQIIYVLPDYYQAFPKPCMGGWGAVYVVIAPDGRALPCQAAWQIDSLTFDNVRDHSLEWIWRQSAAFTAFRGNDWMREPCRSCSRRTIDFGGCRCQAFQLTGDARNADPVCTKSPARELIDATLARVASAPPPGAEPPVPGTAAYVYRAIADRRRPASHASGP